MSEAWVRHHNEGAQAWYYVNTENGETHWDENGGSEEGGEGVAEEEAPDSVDEYRAVVVVRTIGGGPVFKHWALYVEDKTNESDGFVCILEGRRQHYRYVCKRTIDPVYSVSFVDMHRVGYVDTNSLKDFRDFAKGKRIHNEDEHWGCQDWVWEILAGLEHAGLLEHRDQFEQNYSALQSFKGPG